MFPIIFNVQKVFIIITFPKMTERNKAKNCNISHTYCADFYDLDTYVGFVYTEAQQSQVLCFT